VEIKIKKGETREIINIDSAHVLIMFESDDEVRIWSQSAVHQFVKGESIGGGVT
jgi:hypothetical protein